MFRVDYHWDRLKTCVVGSVYTPDHFSWVVDPKIRSSLEKLVKETEEDFQKLIKLLQSFNVKVIRPLLPEEGNHFQKPIVAPRDHMAMIGKRFFIDDRDRQREMAPIVNLVREQGNDIILNQHINSAEVIRLGKDLYWSYPDNFLLIHEVYRKEGIDLDHAQYEKLSSIIADNKVKVSRKKYEKKIMDLFKDYNNHFLGTEGHIDGTLVAIYKGLMLVKEEKDTPYEAAANRFFPGWEKVNLSYLDEEHNLKRQLVLAGKKWWIPGKETHAGFSDFIDHYLNHWITDISETRFSANTLILDEKNVVCVGYPEKVLNVYSRFGITPHLVDFRHRFFWDGGIHCITADLDRGD